MIESAILHFFYHASFELLPNLQVVTKRTCVRAGDFVRHYDLPESRKFARMESRKGEPCHVPLHAPDEMECAVRREKIEKYNFSIARFVSART